MGDEVGSEQHDHDGVYGHGDANLKLEKWLAKAEDESDEHHLAGASNKWCDVACLFSKGTVDEKNTHQTD